jgi:SOS-response transcriptional repressor LexA
MRKVRDIISETRKSQGKKLSQIDLAKALNACGHEITNKSISKWEKGQGEPDASVFIDMCRILGIDDIYEAYYGTNPNTPLSELNEEGKQKVYEYARLLIGSGQYQKSSAPVTPFEARTIRLYDQTVSAGRGNFLSDDSYELISAGNEVPSDTDYALRISGDSMEPRYHDGQIVYIRQQNTLENGEIGIFLLDEEAYIKKLQNDQNGLFLISLNKNYAPIPIEPYSEFSILGQVIG